MVTDLRHLLDLREDAGGPVRKLAEHLYNIVQAATAGDTGTAWQTALPCPRRPGHRACTGRIVVARPAPSGPIHWQCSTCADTGDISGWEGCPFDLRRTRPALATLGAEFVVSTETIAALRDLTMLDPDGERVVFRARAHPCGAALSATGEELEELIGHVAAEANHQSDRRRRYRFDAAFVELTHAAASVPD